MNDNERTQLVETALTGDPVALARLLVSIPSVNPVLSPGGAGEAEIASQCAEILNAWGFSVDVVEAKPGRPNVIARLAGDGPTLLLNGHIDTVGVEGMSIPPWTPSVVDGRLWGRGSCDMKGGVAALMAAAHRLAREGARPNLLVALTADEEHASVGMADLVSGVDPIADLAIVCEPTSLDVMPAHKGFVWLEATFRGRAAHGSRPEVGIDAIRHAALYLTGLDRYAEELRQRPAHPLLQYGSFHAGTIQGGSAESVYPELCTLLLERRTMPGETGEDVHAEFAAVLAAVGGDHSEMNARIDTTLVRPGTEVSTDHRLVTGLVSAAETVGVHAGVEGMTAWVDAAFLNESGVPAVCFGPGSIEQAHTADEWIAVDEIGQCADVLERFARELVTDSA
ncbi:MAG: ArgE/DapE family deacylase [Gemmatimonadota bacterium]